MSNKTKTIIKVIAAIYAVQIGIAFLGQFLAPLGVLAVIIAGVGAWFFTGSRRSVTRSKIGLLIAGNGKGRPAKSKRGATMHLEYVRDETLVTELLNRDVYGHGLDGLHRHSRAAIEAELNRRGVKVS
jgi:flagellar basal body-associated protein FliL